MGRMTRVLGLVLFVTLLGGCSTMINGTAPAKDANTVYAVGAKQGFFWIWHPTVWKCSTAGKSQSCAEVEVAE
jgi:uncharacterized protein YceK